MASFIVRIEDLGTFIEKLEQVAKSLRYKKPELVEILRSPAFRRIKWFYYCDHKEGITLRIFDSEFRKNQPSLFQVPSQYVILEEAEKLGKEEGETKQRIRGLFDEKRDPPPGVNAKSLESAEEYFQSLNQDGVSQMTPPIYLSSWSHAPTIIGTQN